MEFNALVFRYGLHVNVQMILFAAGTAKAHAAHGLTADCAKRGFKISLLYRNIY